jgi:hypothetical protein
MTQIKQTTKRKGASKEARRVRPLSAPTPCPVWSAALSDNPSVTSAPPVYIDP